MRRALCSLTTLCCLLAAACQHGGAPPKTDQSPKAPAAIYTTHRTPLDRAWVRQQIEKNRSRTVPVLMYHSVSERNHPLCVHPGQLELQLKNLLRQGYSPITARELVTAWQEGTSLPARPVVLTFDDGYRDNYTHAFPLLKKYRVKATLFVITAAVGHPGYLSWTQIKEMEQSGLVDVQSHTVHHPDMRALTAEQAKAELIGSRQILEKHLQKRVTLFAYPSGKYKPSLFPLLRAAGYHAAFTTRNQLTRYDQGVYSLRRLRVLNTHTFSTFE